MSAKAVGWALEQALPPAEKVTLIVLADCMNAETGKCCPSQDFIAKHVGVTDRTVRTYLETLEKAHLIRRVKRNHPLTGHRLADGYILAVGGGLPEESSARPTGSGDAGQPEAQASAQEPEGNQKSLLGGGHANGDGQYALPAPSPTRKPVSYRNRKVPKPVLDMAERLLAHLSEKSGKSFRGFTSKGDATPEIKQVIGCLMVHEDVSEERWRKAIENTITNPPDWIEDGKVTKVGHVFGGQAATWALDNPGAKQEMIGAGHSGVDDGYARRRARREAEGW